METTLTNGILSAAILSKGAELSSLKDRFGREYIWEGDPTFWGKHSPVLFPIVGTLKDNRYTFGGTTYELSRHGFARDLSFDLLEHKGSCATFSLKSNAKTLAVYPFVFELRIVYTLAAHTLEIGYELYNRGNETLYFSVGGHPAFALPGDFGSYSLDFKTHAKLTYHLLENELLSPETETVETHRGVLPLDYKLFKRDALVFKNIPSKSVSILKNGATFLTLDFPDFPDLGIWTKIDAPFLCLEPWFGHADTAFSQGALENKEGIRLVRAGAAFKAAFTITLSTDD